MTDTRAPADLRSALEAIADMTTQPIAAGAARAALAPTKEPAA